MKINTTFTAFFFAASFVASGAMAEAQDKSFVGLKKQWGVHVADNPLECWAVSTPIKIVNSRDKVKRSRIQLTVVLSPSVGRDLGIAFTGGYPFKPKSTVTMAIKDETFQMFTAGEWAWPESASDDAKIIAAMKSGTEALLTGSSSRGTVTKDTFSLLGFTAAVQTVKESCDG